MKLYSNADTTTNDQSHKSRALTGYRDYWLSQIRARQLGVAWAVCTLLGALLIFFSNPYDHGWKRVLPPLVFMFSYFLIGFLNPRKNSTKFADSLYFMGFLWTLCALVKFFIVADSTLSANTDNQHKGITASGVLTAFGYSLITTLTGMSLRSLVIQLQITLPDQLDQTQQDVLQYVSELTHQLRNASTEIQDFRGQAEASLKDRLSSLKDSLKQIQQEIEAGHMKASKVAQDTIKRTITSVSASLGDFSLPREALKVETTRLAELFKKWGDKIDRSISTLDRSVTNLSDSLVNSQTNFIHKINAIEVPKDLITTQLEPVSTDLKQALVNLTNSLKSVIHIEDSHAQSLTKTLASLNDIVTTLSKAADASNHFTVTLEALEHRCRQLAGNAMPDLDQRIDQARQAIEEAKTAGASLNAATTEVLSFVKARLGEAGIR